MNNEVLKYVREALNVLSKDKDIKDIRDYLAVLDNGVLVNDELIDLKFTFPRYNDVDGIAVQRFRVSEIETMMKPLIKAAVEIQSVQHYVVNKLLSVYSDRPVKEVKDLMEKVLGSVFDFGRIEDLDYSLVSGVASLIMDYYESPFGELAAQAFIKEPFRYDTKVYFNGSLKGVMSYTQSDQTRVKIKLLAGNNKAMGSLIEYLEPVGKMISLVVPESLESHLASVKSLGFTEVKKDYSKCLNEYLLVMKYSGDDYGR